MPAVDSVIVLIYDVIDEFNETRDGRPPLPKIPDARLFGPDAPLDSLDLARLIISVEDRVADELDAPISLADERAMSQRNSPFRSVESLANYIVELLNETVDA